MTAPADDVAAVQQCEKAYNKLRDELSKVIVGQNAVIERLAKVLPAHGR